MRKRTHPTKAAALRPKVLLALGLSVVTMLAACNRTGSSISPSTTQPTPAAPTPADSGNALQIRLCHADASGALTPMVVEPAALLEHMAHGDQRVGAPVTGQPGLVVGSDCTAVEPGVVRIGFDGLTDHRAALSTYAESGVTVTAVEADWVVSTSYGQPAPFIQFLRASGADTLVGEVHVRAGGGLFRFRGTDIYSSITRIPYAFIGKLGEETVFEVEGDHPNIFGRIVPIENPRSGDAIDTLLIRLWNPATPCCDNPVGLDNIVVVR